MLFRLLPGSWSHIGYVDTRVQDLHRLGPGAGYDTILNAATLEAQSIRRLIRIDEALFLGGRSKGEFLRSFGADIFFDDQPVHCERAAPTVPTGRVPFPNPAVVPSTKRGRG